MDPQIRVGDRNLCILCRHWQVLDEVSSDRTFPYSQLSHQNEELLVLLLESVVISLRSCDRPVKPSEDC
ncbi:hypothetical protein NDA01_16320 [Trichocoleus desertorum AS-A10]|uniref:hypothetical protein n=1 Tax=Trichocoleus desertorum TaxID=1481672 RepID=UPI003296FCD6